MQNQRNRQRRPQAAVIAGWLAPAQFVQHGAGGAIERGQSAMRFREPAMVLDLIGAFDKWPRRDGMRVGSNKDRGFSARFQH
ncbi:hypothetical protein GCM10007901_37620 [Dyella acidisoli]|uniref:Uncharacterized protein n=1 Tax=Dyella acidisoli TaxID=1867834 RepID=A0ABQ5XSZ8_9GAMM|nr:hypothetical protein GCM10007901_37620 [Dyella acidisoli]